MNSVVQCLKRVNELKEEVKEFQIDESLRGTLAGTNPDVLMTTAAKGLMNDLDNKGESFAPINFVNTMRQVFP